MAHFILQYLLLLTFLLISFHFSETFGQMVIEEGDNDDGNDSSEGDDSDDGPPEMVIQPGGKHRKHRPPVLILPEKNQQGKTKYKVKDPKVGIVLPRKSKKHHRKRGKKGGKGGGGDDNDDDDDDADNKIVVVAGNNEPPCRGVISNLACNLENTICSIKNKARNVAVAALS